MTKRMILSVSLALGAMVVVAPVAAADSQAHAAAPKPTVTLLKGNFSNSAKYTGSGTATVTRKAAVRTLRLAKNFRADSRAIRLRLYLATSVSGETHVDLGPLAETGPQTFRVPQSLSLSKYRYVIAWCVAADEPIAQAKLLSVRR